MIYNSSNQDSDSRNDEHGRWRQERSEAGRRERDVGHQKGSEELQYFKDLFSIKPELVITEQNKD